jgi:hypothetical protein
MQVRWLIGFIATPIVAAVTPLWWLPAVERAALAPDGVKPHVFDGAVIGLAAVAALALLPIALIGLAFRKTWRLAAITALGCVTYCAGFGIGGRLRDEIRREAFHQLATRSRPLIAAIRDFEKKYGRPPASLEALVPEFVPSVPTTGMGAYPKYEYRTGSTNDFGNPWVLAVSTPSGGINFDRFLYFPLTNYPPRGYGGWLERIEDWAYVHE